MCTVLCFDPLSLSIPRSRQHLCHVNIDQLLTTGAARYDTALLCLL